MKKTGMNRLVVAAAVFACGLAACGMPTKEELVQAQALVADLTADDVRAMKAGSKKTGEVAAAQVALADEAETEAGKYLLLQGAFRLYSRSADYDAAADVLARMRRDISDLPPEVVVELVTGEFRRVAAGKAEKVMVIYRDARRTIRCRKELAAAEKAATAKPSDAAVQRRVAECHAVLGDWARALETFAKLGVEAAKFELDPASAKDCDASKAADFWWNYPTKDSEPFQVHAAVLYRKGLADGSISGLRKTLAEKRIKQMESVMPAEGEAPVRGSGASAASGKATGNQSKALILNLGGGVKMEMVGCPAGTFYMGLKDCPNWAAFAKGHMVELSRPFWIGKYPVTIEQWERLMPQVKPPPGVRRRDMDGKLPMQGYPKMPLSRADAEDFMAKLTRKFADKLPSGYVFRLPTNAEWEYSLLAGADAEEAGVALRASALHMDQSKAYWQPRGLAIPDPAELKRLRLSGDKVLGWCLENFPYVPVGTRPPNAWGICDMVGIGVEPVLDSWVGSRKNKQKIAQANAAIWTDGVKDPLLFDPQQGPRNIILRGALWGGDWPPGIWFADGDYNWECGFLIRIRLVVGPDLLKERGIK